MLSIVVPVYNESESLGELFAQLTAVTAEQKYDLQVIFVDDGSTDGSWSEIARLARDDSRVRGIRFRRNFGKAAALSAGFAAVDGDVVMTLDGDLQDDPREISRFLAELERGLDVVSGWKKVRHDPWHKVGPSRVFNWLVGALTGVRLHDHNCGMKCYRREVLGEIRLYGELHRFVPVLAAARGFKIGEIAINHRPRQHGHSKYGVSRIVKGFLDLLTVKFLTGYGQRPQHVLGTFALAAFCVGAIGLLYLAVLWVVSRLTPMEDVHLHDTAALYYSLAAFLVGGQFLSIGLLAELITAYHGGATENYSISERTLGTYDPRESQHDASRA